MAKRRARKQAKKAKRATKATKATKARRAVTPRAKPRRRAQARPRAGAAGPRPVPAGYHTATPYLTVRGAAEAIEFYKRALGAAEMMRMPSADGARVMHAELRIGDSVIMLSDELDGGSSRSPQALGATTGHVHLYVADVDSAFDRAVAAGARVSMPLQDMFWGDRYGRVIDPFGQEWGLATHKEDLTPDEVGRRAAAAFAAPSP